MNESEEDGSGNEDWANDICEVSLWTVGLVGICAVWAVVGDGGIKDADEEQDGKGKCTCGGKDDSKEDKVEDGYGSA